MTAEARRLIAGVALVVGAILFVQEFRAHDTSVAGVAFASFVTGSGLHGLLRPGGADSRRDGAGDSQLLRPSYVLIYFVSLGTALALIVWGALSGGAEMVAGAILATPLIILGVLGMKLLVVKLWRSR